MKQKLCKKCGEHWPADTEFFWSDKSAADGLYFCCKACYAELPSVARRNAKRSDTRKAARVAMAAAGEAVHA